jgi:Ca2+-binding EF-hand superfamily protein
MIFDQIDLNKDDRINFSEMQAMLKKTYSIPHFDSYAVNVLIERYDKDGDKQIDLGEFVELFDGINGLHKEFLDADFRYDANGYIDARELSNIFKRKGYSFGTDLYHYIVGEMSRGSSSHGLKFDKYIGIMARFEFLINKYTRCFKKNEKSADDLEKYLRAKFF